ncbi:tRNA lysidine(34) synthetase [Aspergillus stella-maris]|uniref:tRNA lysidine(34) synthetase n=1 Tax=Aspergillus stella-maris TaxID=1810926 RepID=UPI003CCCD2C4
MAQSCLLRSKSKGAITLPQFADALRRTCLEARRFRPGMGAAGAASILPRKLGLAVSGGADSMALAYLCRQWELQIRENASNGADADADADVSVTAFVVDHKARAESTLEANTVAGYLRDLGITAQILPLDWTGISKSAFETQARRLRFQALGTACRDRGIDALLLGHHQDDNVETTIWRLAGGARGAGLAGIAPAARIPECHGLYGVAGSGGSVAVRPEALFERTTLDKPRQGQESRARHRTSSGEMTTGGILLHRPLLVFPKSDLVATCHENGVPYVSDPTNFDPTLTPRNAIRSMLSSESMPKALQNESILSLVQNSQTLIRDLDRLSDDVLRFQCELLDFSLASGSLTVQFNPPSNPQTTTKSQDHKDEIRPQSIHEAQTLSLRRLTELISPFPDNHWSLRSFVGFTGLVFPSPTPTGSSLPASSLDKALNLSKRKPFTLGGTLFTPHKTPSHRASTKKASKTRSRKTTFSTSTSIENENENQETTWRISRQPYFRGREPILRFELPSFTPTLTHATTITTTTTDSQHQQQNSALNIEVPWTLWDNRFWVRASIIPRNTDTNTNASTQRPEETTAYLLIRPLRELDLTALKQQLKLKTKRKYKTKPQSNTNSKLETQASLGTHRPGPDAASFLAKLDQEAPGDSRFTIPVLSIVQGGTDRPLVLPTLDLKFPPSKLDFVPCTIICEWKYKMIDLEALKLMGSV